jgi:pyruvate dehydrogenase E2 component (dihydrolipoamide acetyltransferase)
MADIVMPRLSDTMEEGTILRWLVADGETIRRGQEIVEIETDKATMTYESDLDGPIERLAAEGDTLPVGATIALVGGSEQTTPRTERAPDVFDEPAPDGPAVERSSIGNVGPAQTTRVRASPLARRIARERGLDLASLAGSGPGGRIVRVDVESARGAAPAPPATAALDAVATAKGETTTVELTRTQQAIARRMAESRATIPDFSILAEVDMEACVSLREQLKRIGGGDGVVPTYNDMVVKASALALREHPRTNSSYRDGTLQLHSRVNVGIAVATDDALIVPTVFDADVKALGEIAREARRLAERVRSGEITPPELGGGTFSVSNLGMFGVRSFAPIINPPQAAILSVGALEQRPVVRDGGIVIRNTLALTLVVDHRILYGADAARLLARIRELLEAPAALTL